MKGNLAAVDQAQTVWGQLLPSLTSGTGCLMVGLCYHLCWGHAWLSVQPLYVLPLIYRIDHTVSQNTDIFPGLSQTSVSISSATHWGSDPIYISISEQ